MNFKYDISVIVPVYNVEKYLKECLDSIVNQTIDKDKIEVLLIDDSSTDNSADICKEYAQSYPFFKFHTKENGGVATARNYGIEHSQGKYIAYLDSDDALTPNSLKNIVKFFDKYYDEVDLVTYKIVPTFNGKQSEKLHYRYDYLSYEGVYDLTRPENIYISQTTMNIVVKNMGKDNILFDQMMQEDQKYNTLILSKKMKIGYCTGAKYLYTKNPASATNSSFYSYYIFESAMKLWEDLFSKYDDKVPQYIQALFVNDLSWKTRADILLPYHYEGEKYEKAIGRINALLNRVDDYVILNMPKLIVPHKFFLLSLKENSNFSVKAGCTGLTMTNNGDTVFYDTGVNMGLSRFKPNDKYVYIDGFFRSPVFEFCEKPKAYVHLAGGDRVIDQELELMESAWDYYKVKTKTNKHWRVLYKWDYKKYNNIWFTLEMDGVEIPVRTELTGQSPFQKGTNRTSLFRCGYRFNMLNRGFSSSKAKDGEYESYKKSYTKSLFFKRTRTSILREIYIDKVNPKRRIWLYYDCRNVYKDNGYYQFIHDFEKDDGVERYYVVNDNMNRKKILTPKQRKNVIKFGSLKHKRFLFAAEKIVTGYAEFENLFPFHPALWPYYTDAFKAEVIYLQHGVLHAFLPWKYSNDRLNYVDKEVISTNFEMKNMTENYGFPEEKLIPAGMPRYDFIDANAVESEKKIIFAPTWRKYLVDNVDRVLTANPNKIKKSVFFKETYDFLHSKQLQDMLEKYDWTLDFKLHPILKNCAYLWDIDSDRIKIADNSVDEKSYKIFITDFSSFCFDFVYLKKTIMYFVPDEDMFKAGMNDYRKLDLPLEEGFGPLCKSSQQALESLEKLLERNGEPEKLYLDRMDSFFINTDDKCRDRIYDAIK